MGKDNQPKVRQLARKAYQQTRRAQYARIRSSPWKVSEPRARLRSEEEQRAPGQMLEVVRPVRRGSLFRWVSAFRLKPSQTKTHWVKIERWNAPTD